MLLTVIAGLWLFFTIIGVVQDYRAEKLLREIKGVKNAKN